MSKFFVLLLIIPALALIPAPTTLTSNALNVRHFELGDIEHIQSSDLKIAEYKEEFRNCRATWYGNGFDGRPTASGEIFNQWGFSAASLDYALGTNLLVCTSKDCVTLKVNDKGHLKDCLDLSRGAFNKLGSESQGVLNVRVKVI